MFVLYRIVRYAIKGMEQESGEYMVVCYRFWVKKIIQAIYKR